MEFIKPGSLQIDFVGKRKPFVVVSVILVTAAIIIVFVKQISGTINWGIDFAGGTVIDMEFDKEIKAAEVRKIVTDLGYKKNVIQRSGLGSTDGKAQYIIRVERIAILDKVDADKLNAGLEKNFGKRLQRFDFDEDSGDQFDLRFTEEVKEKEIRAVLSSLAGEIGKKELKNVTLKRQGKQEQFRFLVLTTGVATQMEKAMKEKFPDANPHLRKVEFVGPQVGKKLRTDGILAMIYAIAGILAYVAFRFNFQFAPGAVLALAHDSIITIGVFALFGLEFNLTFVAAILTVIGYSVNDTIVVYDRIRENMARIRSQSLETVVNSSLNEVLNRTILTSVTTILALMGLLILGFGEIKDFAIAMALGVVIGTYSSIYVASTTTIYLGDLTKRLKA
ncbi:MAG: protein translocase subunit SecF [Deltaproteobacteria bacterium]|nr:protein translocase subunit SecF [Deltaproteobacteria bacterium]MBW1872960.1 protein translocase subunit SecF [Deltaproteobacteria bacterium]